MFSSLPFTFLFLFVAVFGTVFSLSSSHWLGVWAGLEINLIGFLPVLLYQKSASESESAVKYFIVQALGSGLLIFGSLLACSTSFTWDPSLVFSPSAMVVVLAGLLTKMGMFPFHFWLPSVMAGLPWLSCMVLATWQKVAPLFLIGALINVGDLYSVILLVCVLAAGSSLVGGFGGMNQTQIRSILAYSSIGHLGWMVFAICHSSWAMKTYFIIYLLISFTVFMAIWVLNIPNAKTLTNLMAPRSAGVLAVMIMLLSLAGLPPLLGFISKWVVLLVSALSAIYPLVGLLVLGSVMSLFYYLSLYFSIFLGSQNSLFLLTTASKNTSLIIPSGLVFNTLAGLCLIFFSLAKKIYALIIFDKP